MATKAKKTTRAQQALAPVRESAQSIWLAGLGALNMAGEEGGKLFQQLVKRGETIDKANRGKVQKLLKSAGAKATDLRDDAEAMFGTRVRKPLDKGLARAMHTMGIPTRGEILELTRRVEALTKAVEKQSRTRKTAPAAPAV